MANLIGDLLNGVQGQSQTPKQDDSLPTSMSDNRLAESISYVNTHGGDPKAAFLSALSGEGYNTDRCV